MERWMELLEQLRGVAPELMLVVLALLCVAVAWLARRVAGLERELGAQVADQVGEALEAQQHELFGQFHAGLERQTERLLMHAERGPERVRQTLDRELPALRESLHTLQSDVQARLAQQREEVATRFTEFTGAANVAHERLRGEVLEQVLTSISGHARADRELLQEGLRSSSEQIASGMEGLSRTINERLETISGHVSQRLDEGFRKTNETFASVMARLATIDEAQKKIDGLTTNVVSLQELLGDKRARGAFGEVQLEALARNMLPPDALEFQYTLPNGTRVDCLLKLPAPTGWVGVDSKFPLENYHRMLAPDASEGERRLAQTAFRTNVRTHVDAIASKYIIDGVTSDGAVMFVPAESVFAEIHAYHPELVAHAQQRRVWIASPTTLMAVLNTARAVLKDVETRKQIHVIKDALGKLAKDFNRFDDRMAALARHIEMANKDVQDVQVSSRKISAHFEKIESARLDELPGAG